MRRKTQAERDARIQAKQLGAQLRRARRALDLTQRALAQRAKCSQPSIARVERGEVSTPRLVKRIAAALVALGSKAQE